MASKLSFAKCSFCLSVSIVLGGAAQVTADTFEWIDPVDGTFSNGANWNNTIGVDPPPPNVGDQLRFNEPGSYIVTFKQNEASDEFAVIDGTVGFFSDSTTQRTFTIATGQRDGNISGGTLKVGKPNNPVFLKLNSTSSGSILNVGSTAGDGTLIINGSQSRVDALGTGSHNVGRNGSTGMLTLDNDATANYGGTLRLGVNTGSDGQVTVEGGGTLNSNHIAIASDTTTAVGSFTVTEVDSSVSQTTPGATLTIGSSSGGTGALNVESSGTFTTGTGATTVNNTGTLSITDGTFNASGALTMASGGTLTLDGGALNASAGLNNAANGTLDFRDGTLTVTGGAFAPNAGGPTDDFVIDGPSPSELPHLVFDAGATANIGRNLFIGTIYRGEMTVTGGGDVSNGIGSIGTVTGSVGTVTVHGAGTTWSNSFLYVGGNSFQAGGTGNLNVEDQGLVDANFLLQIWNTGTVTLDGGSIVAGSFDNSDNGTFNFYDGTLTVSGGAFAPNAGGPADDFVLDGPSPSDLPHLVLDAGATANIGGTLLIGNANRGELTIQNGSFVSNISGIIGDDPNSIGTVTVDGSDPNGNPSTWTNSLSGSLIVGSEGNGTLNIQNGGAVFNALIGSIGHLSGSIGLVTVDGEFSTWTNSGNMLVGLAGEGTLNIQNGGTVSNTFSVFISSNPSATGTATVDGAGSTWTNSEDLYVGGGLSSAGGTGTLNVQNNGLVEVDGILKIWSTGTVTLDGGTIVADTFDHTDGGTFDFIDGTLTADTFLGDLTQDGGTISPGDSPGTTTVTGTYNLNAGTLETEFGGVGNPIDLVDVTGDINIALVGTSLDLIPLGGMAAGTYTLMQTTGGTLTGMFENVTDLGIYDDLVGVQYTANTVTITLDLDLIAGDFDLNGVVDGGDFLKWQLDPSIGDLDDWEANYGMVATLAAASAAVPEPTSVILLSLGGILVLRRFRATVFTG